MIVILHNIRSLYNVGSIFRTADAAGVEKIYLCGITPAPIDAFGRPRTQLTKVSLGAEKYVKWEHCKSTVRLIDKLKKAKSRSERSSATGKNYKIFAVEQSKKSIPYHKIRLCYNIKRSSVIIANKRKTIKENIVLVFGNEISGLPNSILKRVDKILEIPMRGAMVRQTYHPRRTGLGKESLNVAVAFGIVAFNFCR